jgi:uncharacterized protein with PIN domain
MMRSLDPGHDAAESFVVLVSFYGDLGFFVKAKHQNHPIQLVLNRKVSVKDAIECCGVPHPEVDLIVCNGQPVDFHFHLEADAAVDVYPISARIFPEFRLQERNVSAFVADGHLGKLVRDLRLLGIDVRYRRDAEDRELLITAIRENRSLLTRDRPLLMHRRVRTGYFPRSQSPIEQTVEVIRRFSLTRKLAPFSRCLRCNGLLATVSKESVIEQLKPLTRIYYDDFQQCPECGQPYWRGSHVSKLEKRVQEILARFGTESQDAL